ncbi:hypothetical protein DXG01_000502 [Tephrocybe rancida]|nr:hypothetical protein DXG01_000502 [Tephrocybe rancida]
MVLVFVNNAIGTGALSFLPTALTTSLISITLEIYLLLRFVVLLVRQATLASQRPATLRDSRVIKTLSLLLLEFLTIGPSAVHITLLADFIPLSVGALFVLVAFNRCRPTSDGAPILDGTVPSPISAPNIARQSGWFRSPAESSPNRINVETRAPTPGSVPRAILHPFSAQYQQQASRFSTTETVISTQNAVIQTAQRSAPPMTARAIVITPSEMQSFPTASTQAPPEFSSTTGRAPSSPKVEVQASTPEPTPVATPTSLLMHPWHEKRRRRDSADAYNRMSVASTIRGTERTSYTYQGFAFPVPPIPSPTNATRRYSSSTLASPMFSQEGGEDGEGRKTVKLLTFQSSFRNSRNGQEDSVRS